MKLGIDYLLAAGNKHGNYIDQMCEVHPKRLAARFLMVADGCRNGLIAGRALAQADKATVLGFHGLWLDSHHFTEAHIRIAVRQARKVAKFKEKYCDTKIFYSPWLEPGSQQRPTPVELMRTCLERCRNVLPKEIKLVAGRIMPEQYLLRLIPYPLKVITEIHGTSYKPPGKYIYSYDGLDMMETEVSSYKRYYCDAMHFYGWTYILNLKNSLKDRTRREDRTRFPVAEELRAIIKKVRS